MLIFDYNRTNTDDIFAILNLKYKHEYLEHGVKKASRLIFTSLWDTIFSSYYERVCTPSSRVSSSSSSSFTPSFRSIYPFIFLPLSYFPSTRSLFLSSLSLCLFSHLCIIVVVIVLINLPSPSHFFSMCFLLCDKDRRMTQIDYQCYSYLIRIHLLENVGWMMESMVFFLRDVVVFGVIGIIIISLNLCYRRLNYKYASDEPCWAIYELKVDGLVGCINDLGCDILSIFVFFPTLKSWKRREWKRVLLIMLCFGWVTSYIAWT